MRSLEALAHAIHHAGEVPVQGIERILDVLFSQRQILTFPGLKDNMDALAAAQGEPLDDALWNTHPERAFMHLKSAYESAFETSGSRI